MKSQIHLIVDPHDPDQKQIPLHICEGDLEARLGTDRELPADKWAMRNLLHEAAKIIAEAAMAKVTKRKGAPWMVVDFGMDKFVIAAEGCEEFGYEEGFYLP